MKDITEEYETDNVKKKNDFEPKWLFGNLADRKCIWDKGKAMMVAYDFILCFVLHLSIFFSFNYC